MKKLLVIMFAVLFVGFSTFSLAASPEEYSETINTFKKSPAVQKFFNNSYGYAAFPAIGKAGFIIGGTYGVGQVYRNGKVTGKTKLIEGSIGFQLGGKAYRQIIFFQDKRAYDEFTSGGFEFDATAQAVAITAGAGMKAGTSGASASASATPQSAVQAETTYYKGMAIFVHSIGGLMAELSIAGQKYTFEPF